MGAHEFHSTMTAKTAQDAFTLLVEQAKQELRARFAGDDEDEDEDGGCGYPEDMTYAGNIAAKVGFEMERPLAGESALACVNRCMRGADHWAMETDSDAACVDGGADPKRPGYRIFHFFGLARA